jgi:hypothetical protein
MHLPLATGPSRSSLNSNAVLLQVANAICGVQFRLLLVLGPVYENGKRSSLTVTACSTAGTTYGAGDDCLLLCNAYESYISTAAAAL